MDFELTKEQQRIREEAQAFAREYVKDGAIEFDAKGQYPREILQKLGDQGYTGMTVPKEYGGAGLDNICYAIMIEELSRYCSASGGILSLTNSLVCSPLLDFGTEEQKMKYLKPIASGVELGCFGLTEPFAGSDFSQTKTTAKKEGNEWIINGSKIFISNGENADTALIVAVTAPGRGPRGLSTFIVETSREGFSRKGMHGKMGIKSSGLAELYLENVRVPEENLLSKEGRGFSIAMRTLDGGRIGVAAQAVGTARGALDETIIFLKERGEYTGLQASLLGSMAARIDAARLLTYKAAILKDGGRNYGACAASAKLLASEIATRCCHEAIRIQREKGLLRENNVERYLRDARVMEIYEGTSEIQRIVVATSLYR
jgi:butyryl-CoA dehydrogenase